MTFANAYLFVAYIRWLMRKIPASVLAYSRMSVQVKLGWSESLGLIPLRVGPGGGRRSCELGPGACLASPRGVWATARE